MKRIIRRPVEAPLCACGCNQPVKWNQNNPRWNTYLTGHSSKGRVCTKLHIEHLSKSHKGQTAWNKGKKGLQIAWNKGKKMFPISKSIKEKIRKGILKYYETHHNANFGKTPSKEICIKRGNAIHAAYLQNPKLWSKPPMPITQRKQISKALSGPNNYLWRGGIHRPYPSGWTKWLKEEIKQRDNYQCQNSSCKHKKNMLCIHHIDHDKNNLSPSNLITLCVSCHVATNHHRNYWINFYKRKMVAADKMFQVAITDGVSEIGEKR